MSLDKLFHQILLSEQSNSEQTRLSQDVKATVNKFQGKIKTITEELNSAKSQFEEKCGELDQYELQMELLQKNNESRERQKQELLTQESRLREASVEAQRRAREERDSFMEEILSFNTKFNLLVDRQALEEDRAQLEMEALEREEESLSDEMYHMAQSHAGILSLQTERTALQEELCHLERCAEDLETQLTEAKVVSDCLRAERAAVADRPSTDSVFLRLKSEVAELREDELGHMRQALRDDIQRLKKKLFDENSGF
ncbi:hypothetical protein GJAV_G00153050 [Gymnothorax javanicus]|nr:hypothetical protein GJAV_G00153050 [Gymnothorax javanicus]